MEHTGIISQRKYGSWMTRFSSLKYFLEIDSYRYQKFAGSIKRSIESMDNSASKIRPSQIEHMTISTLENSAAGKWDNALLM